MSATINNKWRNIPRLDPNRPRTGLFMIGPDEWRVLLGRPAKNRVINKAKLALYTSEMSADQWKITPDAIGITNSGCVINGQHRGHASIASGKTFPFHVVVGIEEDAFDVIDSGAKRKPQDLFAIAGYTNATLSASICRMELCFRERSLKARMTTRSVLAVADELPYLADAVAAASRSKKDIYGWCSPTALGWVYMYAVAFDAVRAQEWLDGIVRGVNLAATDPRYVTRRHMQRGSTQRWHSQSVLEQVYLLWRSWELFRAGASVTKVQLPKGSSGDPASLWPKAA